MSGPLLDRFQILIYTAKGFEKGSEKSTADIFEVVKRAREFQKEKRAWQKVDNSRLPLMQLLRLMEPNARDHMIPSSVSSQRRKKAVISVARSIADLEGSDLVGAKHLQESLSLAHFPFMEWSQL